MQRRVFGAQMKRWRASRGIPLKQVAADLGVSISTVSSWENAQRFPHPRAWQSLAKLIGLPVWALLCPRCSFGGPEPEMPPDCREFWTNTLRDPEVASPSCP